MVEEIRNMWCDDLEDLLQCPVCMERPKNLIYQCVQGHHICQICKPQLTQCPTCSQRWSDSRNRLAEHLCSKLDDIKLSLIDPENEINKLLIPEKVSVASQTDEIIVGATPPPHAAKKPIDAHLDKPYPCRIGSCNTLRLYEPLLKHIITDHASQFSELASEGLVFQHTWEFDFVEQLIFDRAFLVTDMGTFFLKLSSDIFGNLTGFILMAHNGFIAKQFTYQLEINCCGDHHCPLYTGEVCSCRTPTSVLREKCLQINRQEMQKLIDHKKRLNCTLLLGKKPVTDEPEPLMQNVQKKRNPRSRHQMPKNSGQNGQSTSGSSNYQPVFTRQPRPQTAPNGQAGGLRGNPIRADSQLLRTTSIDRLTNVI